MSTGDKLMNYEDGWSYIIGNRFYQHLIEIYGFGYESIGLEFDEGGREEVKMSITDAIFGHFEVKLA